ncbi:MAG: hypothetical protein CK526_06595 [Thaumarchaeota archaeon]|nr:MAG: hypothetical protein CK526_06595 [Nitrososphaerota archaeon]
MVLGIIIAVAVAAIVITIVIKLTRNMGKPNNFRKVSKCISCGRDTTSLLCSSCKKNADSLK